MAWPLQARSTEQVRYLGSVGPVANATKQKSKIKRRKTDRQLAGEASEPSTRAVLC